MKRNTQLMAAQWCGGARRERRAPLSPARKISELSAMVVRPKALSPLRSASAVHDAGRAFAHLFSKCIANGVARICNLLYRGFSIRQPSAILTTPELERALPNAIRRYSRLQICATNIFPA